MTLLVAILVYSSPWEDHLVCQQQAWDAWEACAAEAGCGRVRESFGCKRTYQLATFAELLSCLRGPTPQYRCRVVSVGIDYSDCERRVSDACYYYDLDHDADVDLRDVAAWLSEQ